MIRVVTSGILGGEMVSMVAWNAIIMMDLNPALGAIFPISISHDSRNR